MLTHTDMETGSLSVAIRQSHPFRMDTTLQCKRGELLALVGPSGSGKSTVLRTIAGLNRTEYADIRCGGEVWDDSNARYYRKTQQRRVGLVFQEYALFPHKSALDNVILATPGDSRKQRRDKAQLLLDKTNMTGLEHRLPSTLSGGQKQRVAIARALAREPTVLLLDEPFSAVDQQTRRKLYKELASLRQSLDLPIVLVTHDLTEVQLLADSLCLMHRGSTLQQGAVASVINYPRSRAIARLVGHQNLFNASVVAVEQNHALYSLGDVAPIRGPLLAGICVGDNASLLIAPSAISIESPTSRDTDNTVDVKDCAIRLSGTVQESVTLGDELFIRLHLDRVPKSLRFKIPFHLALNDNIQPGTTLSVQIRLHGIHVMAQ